MPDPLIPIRRVTTPMLEIAYEEHGAAGHDAIAKKLAEVADELEATAAAFRARRSSRVRRVADGDTAL